ncbi:hypothetical protein R4U18_000515 [Salmonella enterica]|nr:hypothetical protein [Salmonella enterica]
MYKVKVTYILPEGDLVRVAVAAAWRFFVSENKSPALLRTVGASSFMEGKTFAQ